jgi:hypothetical protein
VVSRQKNLVFGVSAVMLALNYWLVVVRPRRCEPGAACHVDSPAMRWNRRVFWVSAVVYLAAVTMTFGPLWLLPEL